MQHIKPMGKGDPLCPLGFHPQVRWPTRCKRCFRQAYSILFVLILYKLVHFITINKIGVLQDDIVSINTFLKTYIKGQKGTPSTTTAEECLKECILYFATIGGNRKEAQWAIVPFRPLLAKQLTKERAHCAEANASRMAGSQGVVWSVCTLQGRVFGGAQRAAPSATERGVACNYESIIHLPSCQLYVFSWLICLFNSKQSFVLSIWALLL